LKSKPVCKNNLFPRHENVIIAGIEVLYELYSPLVQKIQVIRLEKRLDSELFYLRDCPLEYSHFPQDMEAAIIHKGMDIAVNDIKVDLFVAVLVSYHLPLLHWSIAFYINFIYSDEFASKQI